MKHCLYILYSTEICAILVYFWTNFGCHGNSLGSLENLDGIFEIADPENRTIHAKIVWISCTEMNLWLFECSAYLYHCGYR